MLVLLWNGRGAGNRKFLRNARDLVALQKPDCLIIVEPRISGAKADARIQQLRFDHSTKVDARGFSGGIWVLWNNSLGRVEVVGKFSQAITLLISGRTPQPWLLTAVYAHPTPTIRDELWNFLGNCSCFDESPWALIGDFNQILSSDESFGGTTAGLRGRHKMQNFMQQRGIVDLGASGTQYTWTNNSPGNLILRKLDRVLANVKWRLTFPEAIVKNLPRTHGDHCPVLLDCLGLPPPDINKRPFRFQAAWLTNPTFKEVLAETWNQQPALGTTLQIFQERVQKWNRETFGNVFKRKRRLLGRIIGIQKAIETTPRTSLFELEARLVREYNLTLLQEDMVWFQKSRTNIILYGDRNTPYYHTATIIRRRRNQIVSLKRDDGSWTDNQEELKDMMIEFFRKLYQDTEETEQPSTVMNFPRRGRLTDLHLLALNSPITEEEIKKVVLSISPYKAPGGDGLQAIFYQANWDIVGPKICNFVLNSFRDGEFDPTINETLICVIPKVEQPERPNQYRPISLINVTVKIITKLMVSRIRPFLQDIVGPTQSAFIPGRGCHDNAVILQEAVHTMKKLKGKVGHFIMKIDLEKAYDRIDWGFLHWVLGDMGFPETWIELIMHSVSSAKISVLFNGEKTGHFQPKRGLRQGDPLSPYLFVFCLEKLSELIEQAVAQKRWSPLKITRQGPALTHMLFADDLVFFGKSDSTTVATIMEILDKFCKISGQKVNHAKSKIYFSPNNKTDATANICSMTGMQETDELGQYLGVPIHTKRVNKAAYHHLLDRVNKRLAAWQVNSLTMAGRKVLIQSVTSTLANHVMQVHHLPISVSKEIDKANRRFLWGGTEGKRKMSLVKWRTVCTPKEMGGLGLRTTSNANQALLAKRGWNLASGKKSLANDVLSAKYLQDDDLLQVKNKPDSSPAWKGIMWARPIIQEGAGKTVKNGADTSFWEDTWFKDQPLILKANHTIPPEELCKTVSQYWRNNAWDDTLARFLPQEVLYELSLRTLDVEMEEQDSLTWTRSSNGEFTAHSAYQTLMDIEATPIQGSWTKLWDINVAPKIINFMWLVMHNKLLTNMSRRAKGMTHSDLCPRCSGGAEDITHLLRDCPDSKQIWAPWIPGNLRQRWQELSREDWIDANITCKMKIPNYRLDWAATFTILCWHIWTSRNQVVFERRTRTTADHLRIIKIMLQEAEMLIESKNQLRLRQEIMIGWSEPPTEWVKVNVDGSALGNPGQSAAGGLCHDKDGNWLFGFNIKMGNGSAYQAEVFAIWQGLQLAWDRGFERVIIESDSAMAIHQIMKPIEQASHWDPIVQKCKDLLARNWECVLKKIYREGNTCADVMASSFYHLNNGLHVFDNPPPEVAFSLLGDRMGIVRPRAI